MNSKLFASFFPVPASPAPEARYWRGPSGYRASDVYIALYGLLQEGPAMAFQLAQEHIGLVHPRTGEHLVLWSQYGWSPTPRISTAITITHTSIWHMAGPNQPHTPHPTCPSAISPGPSEVALSSPTYQDERIYGSQGLGLEELAA